MGRIFTAIRAFFRILFDRRVADETVRLLSGPTAPPPPVATAPTAPPKPAAPPAPKKPARNDAVTLLAALQREARLVDFLQETLDGYSDAQIGAAVRDVQRDARAALARLFDLRPLTDAGEGASLEVPAGADALKYRLVGNVAGSPPYRGTVRHHGWQVSKCELPEWTGSAEAQNVVAPIEVEVS